MPSHPFDKRWYVHLDAKIQGPYSGHDIQQMIELGEITFTDLVYSEGGSAWVQVGHDPILGTLFARNGALPAQRAGRRFSGSRVTRRAVAIACAFVVLAVASWIAWPYYAAYKLAVAVRDGDALALEYSVAWDSVRQGLRDDLNAALLQTISANTKVSNSEPGAALGSGLAAVLGPAIIDRMVNSYITPQAIATFNHANKAEPVAVAPTTAPAATNLSETIRSARKIRWEQIQYAFFSGGPFTFKVAFIPEHATPIRNPISLIFVWSGNWKLSRIVLPADAISSLSTVAKSLDGQGSPAVNLPPPAPSSTPLASAASIQKELAPLRVRLVSKGFKSKNINAGDFEDDITIALAITNATDKDIRAFDGVLTFTDLLDNEIYSSKLAINETVRSGSTLNWSGSLHYNQFIESHQHLRTAQQANLKITFSPRKLLFVDGSTKEYNSH